MIKNGTFFISYVDQSHFKPSVWDPYFYRTNGLGESLGDYVKITKLKKHQSNIQSTSFCPVEYSSIPKGSYLTFVLEPCEQHFHPKVPMVGEQQLLFGTMRAYLGNVIVTPKAKWIYKESPLHFSIKSEFVCISPIDNCIYFWWAYIQSSNFLRNLPLGSGGTRPRLNEEALLKTPIQVPDVKIRQNIHERLMDCAEHEWNEYAKRMIIINSMKEELHE